MSSLVTDSVLRRTAYPPASTVVRDKRKEEIKPFSVIDSVKPPFGTDRLVSQASIYQRNGNLVRESFDGNSTKFQTLTAHEASFLPRLQRNMLADLDITDVSNWTVDAGVTFTYDTSTGWFRVQNISAGTMAAIKSSTITLSAATIEGMDSRSICEVYNADATNSGIYLSTQRATGGTYTDGKADTILTSTSALDPDVVATDIMTGIASNVGVTLNFREDSTATPSDDFYFRFPTVIDVTGLTNQEPEIIPCDTPVGPELNTAANATSPTNETDATTGWSSSACIFTSEVNTEAEGGAYAFHCITTANNAKIYEAIGTPWGLVTGKRYVIETKAILISGGVVRYRMGSTSGGSETFSQNLSSTSEVTTFTNAFTHGTNTAYVHFVEGSGTDDSVWRVLSISIREATTGLLESNYTNGNKTFAGIVEEEPFHWAEFDGVSGTVIRKPLTNSYTAQAEELTIHTRVYRDNWTVIAGQDIIASNFGSVGGEKSWYLRLTTSEKFGWNISQDGINTDGAVMNSDVFSSIFPASGIIWLKSVLTFDPSTGCSSTFFYSLELVKRFEDVVTWIAIGSGTSPTITHLFDANGAQDLNVGTMFDGTSSVWDDEIFIAHVADQDGNVILDFDAETAIVDGWNLKGGVQLKTNTPLPLHPKTPVKIGHNKAVRAPARYEHFPLSTVLDTNTDSDRTISTLANATYSNGSQGIFNEVEAFPNLITPYGRVILKASDQWTQTGAGSKTPVGDGVELFSGSLISRCDEGGLETFEETAEGYVHAQSTSGGGNSLKIAVNNYLTAADKGDWFVLAITVEVLDTNNAAIWPYDVAANAIDDGLADREGNFNSTSGERTINFLFKHEDIYQYRIRENNGSNLLDIEVRGLSLQRLSYVVLEDADDTAAETEFVYTLTVPDDSQTYRYSIVVSEGTAEATDIFIRFSGGVTIAAAVRITWATNTVATSSGSPLNTTLESLGSGLYSLSFEFANDSSGNTDLIYKIFPASVVATTQGTANVHGSPVIQRVSAVAEPEWNPLKPGESVTQMLLQQQDFDTTWTNTNGATTTQDETDVFGNENTAWTLEDSDAGSYKSMVQTGSATAGDDLCGYIFIKKEASTPNGNPCLRLNLSSGNIDVIIDPVTGGCLNRTGGADTADRFGSIDGAVIKALLPAYTNADSYWLVWASVDANVDASPAMTVYPALNNDFTDGATISASGIFVFDMPTMHKGKYPFFFDAVATTATVTEVVQDWSKIFTPLTEATNNAVNAVFSHGHYLWHGMPNSTALTNLVTTPAHVASAEAGWTLGNTFTSETDVPSVFSGEFATQFVEDTTNGLVKDIGTTLSSGVETVATLVEVMGSSYKIQLRIYDVTAGGSVVQNSYDHSDGSSTVIGAEGTGEEGFSRSVGKGPNGGDLVWVLGRATASTPTNSREIWVFPNGQSPVVGSNNIVHYVGAYESSHISICPILDGSTRVVDTWEYNVGNMDDAKGTLVADLTYNLDDADMPTMSDEIVGTNLLKNGALGWRTSDVTVGKSPPNAHTTLASDPLRAVVRWSYADNEHTLRIHDSTLEDNEDSTTITYDGSMNMSTIELFTSPIYEARLSWLGIWKESTDSNESLVIAEYD